MQNDNFRGVFKTVSRANSKIVKSRGKCWFLKVCLQVNVIPLSLRSRVRDPAAHQPGYTPELAAAWRRAQHHADKALVREASEREQIRFKGEEKLGKNQGHE